MIYFIFALGSENVQKSFSEVARLVIVPLDGWIIEEMPILRDSNLPSPTTLEEEMEKIKEWIPFDEQLKEISKKRNELSLILNWIPFDSKKEQEIYQLWDRYPFLLALSKMDSGRCFFTEFLSEAYLNIAKEREGKGKNAIIFKKACELQEQLAKQLGISPKEADDFFRKLFEVFQILHQPIRFIENLPSALPILLEASKARSEPCVFLECMLITNENIDILLTQELKKIFKRPLSFWSAEGVAQLVTLIRIIYAADVILESRKTEIPEDEKEKFLKAFSQYNRLKDGLSQKEFINVGLAFIKKFALPTPESLMLFPIREVIRGAIEQCGARVQEVWCKVMLHACEQSFDKVIEYVKGKYPPLAFYRYFLAHNKAEFLEKFLSYEQLRELHKKVLASK